jgi:hypothetical protein
MESDKTFQDIKDLFFNTLKEKNIEYDEIYYKNFQIVTFGRVVKMNELLDMYNDAYDLVLKVNIIINEEFKKCINKTSLNFICNMVKEKDTVRIAGDKFKNLLNRSKNRNKINKSNDYCYNIINLEEDKKATNDTENIEHIINSILINRLNFEYLLKLFETDIIRQDNSSQKCDKNIITDLFTNATTGFLNFFEQHKTQAPPQGQGQGQMRRFEL